MNGKWGELMGKYVHSYSSLAEWRICPRLFKRKFLDKAFPFEETAATKRGNRLHKAMEDVFNEGADIPPEWKGKTELIKLLRQFGAQPEVKLGMTADGRGCQFFDNENVWLRGKIDLYVAVPSVHTAIMIDWKSGNPNYTDKLQAEVYGAIIGAATTIEKVLFIWGYFSGEMPHEVIDCAVALPRVRKIATAVEEDTEYPPTPCWKCRYCPDTSCRYNQTNG